MKSAIICFPCAHCDRDVGVALEQITGVKPFYVWHKETSLPDVDLIVLPGGFTYGDYLRCGAIAARSPLIEQIRERANTGVAILGICNGFQILTEAGLLPGVLMCNTSLRFTCRTVKLRVENTQTPFTNQYNHHQIIRLPVAHKAGNYFADRQTIRRLEQQGRIVFRYLNDDENPNGSVSHIAGIVSETGRILGMMPHPERAIELLQQNTDGLPFFRSLKTHNTLPQKHTPNAYRKAPLESVGI